MEASTLGIKGTAPPLACKAAAFWMQECAIRFVGPFDFKRNFLEKTAVVESFEAGI